ncbi:MAG: IclR family transcriptional regulator [bacterium]
MSLEGSVKGLVKSVWRAVKILESFDRGERGMGVTELSRRLGFPKSSVHDILSTLEAEGIVERDPDSQRYRLGLKLFELGNMARSNLELRKVAVPFLKELNSRLDETVHLTVLDEGEVLYIECFESTKRLRTYSVIGVRAPLHCTAVGKAILAFLPEDEADEIIRRRGLERFTENTITDPQRLKEELARIRSLGYSVDNMEHEEGVKCVGAPIRNNEGKVFASISVSGPSQRITPERIPEIAELVVTTAKEISRRIGM